MVVLKAAIITIVYIVLLESVEGDFSFSHTQKWPYNQESRVFVHSPVMDNTSVTWATCDYLQAWHTEPKCTLRRLIYHNDGTSESLSCDVNLTPKMDDVTMYGDFRLVPFGKDRAILISAQVLPPFRYVLMKFSAVHFPTCNVIQNSLTFKPSHSVGYWDTLNHFVAVAAYDDKYDVIHKDDNHCGKELCIMSIDSDGKVITEAHAIPIEDFGQVSSIFVVPVSSNSVSKGYVMNQRDMYIKRENQVSFVLPSGVKDLKHVNYSSQPRVPIISMTHNLFSFCDKVTDYFSSYFCAMCDQQGNLRKEMKFDYNTLKEVKFIHNLPGGGFLLFSSALALTENRHIDQLIRIDSEGNVVPFTFEIEKFSCEAKGYISDNAYIFEKHDTELCVAQACKINYDPIPIIPTFDFTVKCVNYDALEKVLGDIRARR